jgi:hypothetical protein
MYTSKIIVFHQNAKTVGTLPEWPSQRTQRIFPRYRLAEALKRIGCVFEFSLCRFLIHIVRKNRQHNTHKVQTHTCAS